MKIAIVARGGLGRTEDHRAVPCFLWLIERLTRAGDEVHVFMMRREPNPATWKLLGATIHNAGRRYTRCRMLSQILVEHRHAPFTAIFTLWSLWANMMAVVAGLLLRVPTLAFFGDGEMIAIPDIAYGNQLSIKSRILFRLVVAGASRIATQSNSMVVRGRMLGVNAMPLPFGVALDRWPSALPRRRVPGTAARLLHVGWMIPVKDHDMLLDTALRLRQMGAAFEIDCIGEDVDGTGEIQRRAQILGLSDIVRFHGFLPHKATRPLFERADLLLVTSRHEAGPLVALEAAIAGVPAVGTRVGHLEEWAPDAARVVEPRDSAGLAREIAALLSDENERLQLAVRAQALALAENADVTCERLRRTLIALAS